MRYFSVRIEPQHDIPAVLSEALRNMRSLAASPEDWASLLRAMEVYVHFPCYRGVPERSIEGALMHIINTATPVEGEIHPQRASWLSDGKHAFGFGTPGGVRVCLNPVAVNDYVDWNAGIDLYIQFNRNSTFLATCILADIFRRVPAAAPLLAKVAAQAAEKVCVNTLVFA